jgi:glycosyltransferase involved in cell wall biosynthesis
VNVGLPFISVVIPTFRRPRQILDCVQSFESVNYPRDRFELIVVDDGSPQPVRERVQSQNTSIQLKCLRQQQAGPAQARNYGLEAARGEFVAFTDDDCRPAANWLAALAEGWSSDPEAALAGPVQNALRGNLIAEATQVLIDYCIRYFDPPTTGRGFFTANNMAFPARTLRQVGGFNTGFPLAAAEDRELCSRWSDHGGRFRFVPSALIHHFHDLNVVRFGRQHFNYGRGARLYHRARATQASQPLKIEPWRFYAGLLATPFDGRPLPQALCICTLLASSQALNAIGYFYQRWRSVGETDQAAIES